MLSGLTFGAPWWLLGLCALPILTVLFLWAEYQATVRLARLIQTPRLRAQLTGAASGGRRRVRYVLLLLGLAALIVALAAPRLGYETHETHRRGLDLIVMVDVSKSMLATDLPPTRLARAKLAVQDFVAQLEGDRVGLVAFAGTAFLQAPLTVDYDAVLNSANELNPDIIPRGGTNLGDAIDLAVDAFGKAEAGNRAILVLSDGEPTTEGEQAAGLKAAGRAADAGVKVFALGFGTPEGSLIPLGGSGNFVRDGDGQIVRTKLDEAGMTALAKAGGGFYVRFNGDAAIQTVVRQGLSQLKAGEINARQTRRPIERYQWPLGAGLVLLGTGAFLSERRKQARAAVAVAARRSATVATTVAVVVLVMGGLPAVGRAEERAAASPNANALDLYKGGRYDEAYKAFQDLAAKHPDQGSLPFNAGASAYKGKQYDEALDAFTKALTSENPDLQAKANYNFGNTLFRRGDGKPEQQEKVKDWKNALEHYDAALAALQRRGKEADPAVVANAKFNRDLVQKRLDELPKPPSKSDQKKDKDDKKDDQDKEQKDGEQPPPQQDQKQDQDKPQDGNQPPKPDQKQGKEQQDEKKDGQNGGGQNQQKPPDKGDKPSGEQKKQQQGGQPPQPSPGEQGGKDDATNASQDKPREHGDFQAKPGEGKDPQPGDKPEEGDAKEEAGKMNASQARSLLDSLKGEDAHVNLGGDQKRRHANDEPPLKDW